LSKDCWRTFEMRLEQSFGFCTSFKINVRVYQEGEKQIEGMKVTRHMVFRYSGTKTVFV